MATDSIEASFTLSNVILVIFSIIEFTFIGILILWKVMDYDSVCGTLLFILSLLVLLYILIIVIAIAMISSNKKDRDHSSMWVVCGIVNIIGLAFLFASFPIYPFVNLITLYVIVFPYVNDKIKGITGLSIVLYFIGFPFMFIYPFIRGSLDDIVFLVIGGVILSTLLTSHILHIYANVQAKMEWSSRKDTQSESISTTSKDDNKKTDRNKPKPGYEMWIEPSKPSDYTFTPKPDLEKDFKKPRELKPPGGFSFPEDD